MTTVIDLFEKLGLTRQESECLLELVKLGASPVSTWARQGGVKRSSMYVLLERLKSRGLVTTFVHDGVLHAQAVAVAELPAMLSDKQEEVARTRKLFVEALPELQKLESTHGLMPKVSFYEGEARVGSMYEKVVREKSFKSFFNPARVKKYMPKYFHKIPQMIRDHGGSARELLVEGDEAREYRSLYLSKKHEIAILPEDIRFSSDTIITEQKIYLVGYSERGVLATEIWNEELAHTQSVLFDLIWSGYGGGTQIEKKNK